MQCFQHNHVHFSELPLISGGGLVVLIKQCVYNPQMQSLPNYLAIIVCFTAAATLSLWIPLTVMPFLTSDKLSGYGLSQILALGLSFGTVYVFNCFLEKRTLSEIGLEVSWTKLKMVLPGALIGILMISVTFVLMISCGAIRATFVNPTIKDIQIIPLLFAIQFLQVMSEEVIFRTYILVKLSERLSVLTACVLWGVLFGSLHLLGLDNSPIAITGIIFAGTFMNLAYFVSNRNPWFTLGIHYAWNTLQMHILFSKRFFNISYSPIWWLGGTSNGAEGSIASVFVIAIAAIAMIFAYLKKRPCEIHTC